MNVVPVSIHHKLKKIYWRKHFTIGLLSITGILCLAGFLLDAQTIRFYSEKLSCVKQKSLKKENFFLKMPKLSRMCQHFGKTKTHLRELEMKNKGHIPDVIEIGVRKCGTGVIMNFLRRHGSFSFPLWPNYETEYFSRKKECGLEWYLHRFRSYEVGKLFIEKTPHYFYAAPSSIPTDILSVNPNVKVVLILCDPTIRAFSCFVHHFIGRIMGNQTAKRYESYITQSLPQLQLTLSVLNNSAIEDYLFRHWNGDQECLLAGLYSLHIQRWMHHFKPSQLLILNGEDLMKDPGPKYVELQKFLGVPQEFRLEDWEKPLTNGHFCLHPPRNRSLLFCQADGYIKGRTRSGGQLDTSKTKPSRNITEMVQQFYKPYNELLYKILNKNFDWM